jgi:hypothetical protein
MSAGTLRSRLFTQFDCNRISVAMSTLESYTQAVRHTAGSTHLTYDGLKSLLNDLGYDEYRLGTAPSHRIAFIHRQTGHIIRLNRPDMREYLTDYQLREVFDALDREPPEADSDTHRS